MESGLRRCAASVVAELARKKKKKLSPSALEAGEEEREEEQEEGEEVGEEEEMSLEQLLARTVYSSSGRHLLMVSITDLRPQGHYGLINLAQKRTHTLGALNGNCLRCHM